MQNCKRKNSTCRLVYVQLVATFRHGREDDETMGLSFQKEIILDRQQVWINCIITLTFSQNVQLTSIYGSLIWYWWPWRSHPHHYYGALCTPLGIPWWKDRNRGDETTISTYTNIRRWGYGLHTELSRSCTKFCPYLLWWERESFQGKFTSIWII